MKKLLLKLFFISFLILISTSLFSQILEQESINSSDLIIEANIEKIEYRYKVGEFGEIETLNYLNVIKVLKGNVKDKDIIILTNGGVMNDFVQTSSHGIKFHEGQQGIFFLTNSEENTSKVFVKLSRASNQFIAYIENDPTLEAISLSSNEKFRSRRELLEYIKPNLFAKKLSIRSNSEVCLTIDNIVPNVEFNKLTFDVKIKANANGYLLSELSLNFSYPSKNIGMNIVANANILLSPGIVVDNNIYDLSMQDATPNSASINIITECIEPLNGLSTNYYSLSTNYEKLLTIELDVSEWGNYGELSLNSFTFSGTAKHIIDDVCLDFDVLCTDDDDFSFNTCQITKFLTKPFGAGIQQIMTIEGDGFGFLPGRIFIPNADDGGATKLMVDGFSSTRHIKSWSDDKIEVLVSSIVNNVNPMGSGKWIVEPIGVNLSCNADVDIEYANSNSFNASNEWLNSIATNLFAGITSFDWYLDKTSITTNTKLMAQGITFNDFKSVCEAAFCDWETASGIEFKYAGDNPSGIAGSDQKNTIGVGALLLNDKLAITKRNISTPLCNNPSYIDPFIDGRLFDADILIDEDDNWFVSTSKTGIKSNEFDLYSVLLHEIGHMLLLDHAMDIPMNGTADDRIMYYALDPQQIKRNIDGKSLNGTNIQKSRTQTSINGGCLNAYVLNTNTDNCMTPTHDINNNHNIKIANPIITGNRFTIRANDIISGMRLIDVQGKIIRENKALNTRILILDGIPNKGSYILQLKLKNNWVTKKIIVI